MDADVLDIIVGDKIKPYKKAKPHKKLKEGIFEDEKGRLYTRLTPSPFDIRDETMILRDGGEIGEREPKPVSSSSSTLKKGSHIKFTEKGSYLYKVDISSIWVVDAIQLPQTVFRNLYLLKRIHRKPENFPQYFLTELAPGTYTVEDPINSEIT